MKETKYKRVWDLNKLFFGGSESLQLREHLEELEMKVNHLEERLNLFCIQHYKYDTSTITALIDLISEIQINLSHANSFVTCLLAQNSKDQFAPTLRGKTSSISARFDSATKRFRKTLVDINKNEWNNLNNTKALDKYKFILNEWRNNAQTLLSDKEEELISNLMIDGYHAWGELYQSLISSLRVYVSIDGEKKEFSVGQAINLRSHPSEEVRKESHVALEDIWKEKEELFSKILNHIAGFRLQVFKKRGIENILGEALKKNRLKKETLNAMWTTVTKYKQPFSKYLYQKAKILGDKKMQAYNFWAPITKSNLKMEYEDAVNFILNHFKQFGPELEHFTYQAVNNGWIDVKDRPHKSANGFCAGFPLSEESRIMLTYGDRITSVLTLAHELGHAFHNHAMKNVDGLNRQYPMSMAETASTFSEIIILDAAIEKTVSLDDKLFLLDEKLKRSVMNFMNIHSRFIFEEKFYEERKKGIVSSSRLNELTKESLNEGYQGSMENISAHSWVWTPHYYITKSPFYNFPYTFGYLFSLSIYARFKEKGKKFEKDYIELLCDSGSMSTEELVEKHLGEDITSEAFWEKGIKLCVKDAEEFIRLTS